MFYSLYFLFDEKKIVLTFFSALGKRKIIEVGNLSTIIIKGFVEVLKCTHEIL